MAYSLEDMIVSLASRARRGERLAFRELLVAIESKSGMVTIFMAVLELLKQQELVMFYENDDIIFTAPIIGERHGTSRGGVAWVYRFRSCIVFLRLNLFLLMSFKIYLSFQNKKA